MQQTKSSPDISRIVEAVLRIPTPENSQPWKIEVDQNHLQIFHRSERAKLATFPDDLSILGIGMLSESLELAASIEGLKPEIHYDLDDRTDQKPWLIVEFKTAENSLPNPLAEVLLSRHTDRRRYAGGSLDDLVFTELKQMADTMTGVNLYCINQYLPEYLQLLQDADRSVMEWDEMRHDMSRWMRFTDREIRETSDGMPWRSLLRGPETRLHYLQSRFWWLATRLDWFPNWLMQLQRLFFDDSGELTPLDFDDGACLGCVTTSSGSREDLIAAGRLVLKIWLLLNYRGYGLQPLTNLVSITYPRQLGTFELPDSVRDLVVGDYEILQRSYGFVNGELPVFCFRTGLAASKYPANARTLRLDR